MKVVVTGGSGFIGSHVTELLIKKGCSVTIIDNLEGGRLENIEHLVDTKKLTFIEEDIRNGKAILPFFKNIDGVIHLAALADIVPSIEDPREYFETNVAGTLNVLEAAREHRCRKLVYAASSSCYGIPDDYPTKEDSPIQPEYPYALTKHLGEKLVLHWCQVYGLNAISLRLFNVYGPRVRTNGAYGAVLGVFLAQRANYEPLTIVGDGHQTRDFTHVKDVARAFIKALDSELSAEIMNVGSGGHYSINTLASLIGGERTYIPKRPGEPDCTFADTHKIQERLGWLPEISLETGVRELLSQLEHWKAAPLWNPESIKAATQAWFDRLG